MGALLTINPSKVNHIFYKFSFLKNLKWGMTTLQPDKKPTKTLICLQTHYAISQEPVK